MGRHKSYDRDEVLDRAMKLFWEKGYEGAHLQELVEATGLNRFSLYKEFGSKDGLFDEAFEKYLGMLEYLVQILNREPKGLDNIRQYFEELIKFPFYHGCFAVNNLTHHPAVPQANREKLFDFFNKYEACVYENMKAAQESGEIGKDIDIESFVKLLFVIDVGLVVFEIFKPKLKEKHKIVNIMNDLLLGAKT